jgi:hypothetical protein
VFLTEASFGGDVQQHDLEQHKNNTGRQNKVGGLKIIKLNNKPFNSNRKGVKERAIRG